MAKAEEKWKAEAERKATEVALKSLRDAESNGFTARAENGDADMVADIKGQLYRFYIAWNVWDPPDVGGIAATHVHSVDTLNALLRDKYHGTDLTWTPEQIGQHMLSISSLSDGVSSPQTPSPPKAQPEGHVHDLDQLTASLEVFYTTWGVERSAGQLQAIANDYKDKQEALKQSLQEMYHGTDMSLSEARLSAVVKSVRQEEAEAAVRKQRETKEAEETARKLEAERLAEAKRVEQKRLELETADERARIQTSLRSFYTSWSSSRNAADIHGLALQYLQDPEAFNAKMRVKYHGTDISWNERDILEKCKQVKEEEEAAQRAKAREAAAAEEKREQDAAEAARKEAEAIFNRLKDFYSFWGAARPDEEVREIAMQYADDVLTLKSQLRITFNGTDFDWTRERLKAKKAELEATAEAKRKAASEAGRQAQKTQDALQELAANLAQFYAAWDTTRGQAECSTLADKYLHELPTLNQKLRQRYSGTDLSTAVSDIVQLKRKQTEEKDAAQVARKDAEAAEATALKKAQAVAAAAAKKQEEEAAAEARMREERAQEEAAQRRAHEAARREREVALHQRLTRFYGAWGMRKGDAELHKIAADYAGRQAELNELLRGKYSGSDLTWDKEQILVLVAQEEQKQKREQERAETESLCRRLVAKLSVFFVAWGVNRNDELEGLASEFVLNEDGLNRLLRLQYHGLFSYI